MEISEIEKKYQDYEEMIVTNINNHYAQYISIDYLEMGDEQLYLLDDSTWYLYWLDTASSFYQHIEVLISNSYNDPEIREQLEKALILKEKLDKQLLKYGGSEEDILNDIYGSIEVQKDIKQEIKYNPIRLNSTKYSIDETIKYFHEFLIKNALIDHPLDDNFKSHFYDDQPSTKLIFEKDMTSLIRLIKYLDEKGFIINNNNIVTLIEDHFEIRAKPNYTSLRRLIYKPVTPLNDNYIKELNQIFR